MTIFDYNRRGGKAMRKRREGGREGRMEGRKDWGGIDEVRKDGG